MDGAERLAVIEAGSKGIRLLVVERCGPPEGMEILRSQGDLGFLGEGLEENQGRMRPENIQRSLGHIHNFLALARSFQPERIFLVGTEVLRRAANVDEFRARLPPALELRVLTPEEEAVGSFLAASWGFRGTFPAGGWLVLLDLGGGSLEVVGGVQGTPPEPAAEISLRGMGTLALREVWKRCGGSGPKDEELRRHLEAEIDRHGADFSAFHPPAGSAAAGPLLVAGLGSTVTDSAWILAGRHRKKYSSERVHGLEADVKQMDELRRLILHDSSPRFQEELGLKDLLGHQLGLAALLAVLRRLRAPAITACGTGLRFGLAYAFLHNVPLRLAPLAPPPAANAAENRQPQPHPLPSEAAPLTVEQPALASSEDTDREAALRNLR